MSLKQIFNYILLLLILQTHVISILNMMHTPIIIEGEDSAKYLSCYDVDLNAYVNVNANVV